MTVVFCSGFLLRWIRTRMHIDDMCTLFHVTAEILSITLSCWVVSKCVVPQSKRKELRLCPIRGFPPGKGFQTSELLEKKKIRCIRTHGVVGSSDSPKSRR
ncbi:hypothetical protein MPTK2_7g03370 [Marchantia polymorpha subsp. ruderalis]